MNAAGATADIGRILDDSPWTGMQKAVVLLAALSIVMDGFDGQLIGFAIPLLIKEWHLTRGDFAPVVAAGLVGMGIGSACAGLLADRFGRRSAIIGSVFLFGAATCAIGFSPNLWAIAALRFVAGLGIGGALPSSTTMTAEFTPARRRTLAVTATICCVPLGGMLAGVFASYVLPGYGWRGLFVIGGLLAVGSGVALAVGLPESPRFLVRRPGRWGELGGLLGRMSRPTAAGTVFTDIGEQRIETREGFPALFQQGRARDTVAIWCAFFLCCAAAAASAFFLQTVDAAQSTNLLILGFGVHGMFVNAVQSTMYAVCAFVYPTNVRATGTASALAFGRLGAILSAFAGAAVITAGGASGFLAMLGLSMCGVLAALLVAKRHIPAPGRASAVLGAAEALAGE